MGTLAELGLDTEQGSAMLIEPPDDALAEAGRMKPRPSVASSFIHAEPARWIVWWPARDAIDAGALERLHWFVTSIAESQAWIVVDPEDADDGMSPEDLAETVEGARFRPGERRPLSNGEVALAIEPLE